MFKLNRVFLLLAAWFVLAVAGVQAQDAPAVPAAVRLRIAHLAPFQGSGTAQVTVKIDGAAVANNLVYGDRTDYLPLAGGPGPRTVEVTRDGAPVVNQVVAIADGNQSLVVIGNDDETDLTVWVLNDAGPVPPPGQAELRVAHAASIGATIDATRLDVCNQDGQSFDVSGDGLRYFRTTFYRQLAAASYDLKTTRHTGNGHCNGQLLADLPPLALAADTVVTLFLVGDGDHQPLGGFTFGLGLLEGGSPQPDGRRVFLPAQMR